MTNSNEGSPEATSTGETIHRTNSDDGPRKVKDTKRVLACGTCRKRKLKCDSKRPKCSTCARLGHPCEYDEVRKKSGPKRGYVKSLEARLNQLENLLEQNRDSPNEVPPTTTNQNLSQTQVGPRTDNTSPSNSFNVGAPDLELGPAPTMTDNDVNLLSDMVMPGGVDFSWDMISLGLEEPLPSQDIMDELYQTYFQKIHPSIPMIHRPRFMASLNLGPNSRPPVALRYIMWANACSVTPKYEGSSEQFYRKARKYLEKDEMQGHGESFITVAHAQAWNLVSCYEFKQMYFPRAWISVGRAVRLIQMLGLHRQDRVGLDVKQTLAPPKDWTDREERRRTFWAAYCNDRYASIGTGWPMTIDEQDILTNLPASEESFYTGSPDPTPMLADVMKGDGVSAISAFSSVILLATLFGRNLTHLHRPSDDDNDHDTGGEFWKRHRSLDNVILNISLSLPGHLRLPQGINDPKVVFSNMNIHTTTICLHQAAIFKADKHKLPAQISSESKRRCLVAADQIANLMRMVSHQDLTAYLKFKRDDHTVRSSLIFLLQAMNVLKKHNPLTESFLVQLDVDLEGSGIGIDLPPQPRRSVPAEVLATYDGIKCSPVFEIREQQSTNNFAANPSGGVGLRPDALNGPLMPVTNSVEFNDMMEQNPYFSTRVFDNLAPDQTPPFSHGDSSSRSHSNHPTPSSSTQNTNPSYSSHNTQGHDSQAFSQPQKERGVLFNGESFSVTDTAILHGVMPGGFEMSPSSEERPVASTQTSTEQQSTNNMNMDQFDIGRTGLTPGPTGLAGSNGMPAPYAMSPLSEWQNMNLDENNSNWMF